MRTSPLAWWSAIGLAALANFLGHDPAVVSVWLAAALIIGALGR